MKDKDFIKVLTGVRRCGKSTILQAFVEELIRQGISSDQVQVYNFEDLDNAYLQDYQALHKQISDKLVAGKMNYVFLDEIQMVDQFEKALNSLFLKDNLDLYITGSNAYMLSGEL
ncbi:MAG: AAA family ATPase, partial [Clostridiaceae bacterium]|nr:AAA family ATPase [Clostridiaceae bacterium]